MPLVADPGGLQKLHEGGKKFNDNSFDDALLLKFCRSATVLRITSIRIYFLTSYTRVKYKFRLQL